MSDLVEKQNKSTSIECKEANLTFRKIISYPPKNTHHILKKMVWEYKLQRGATATILTELKPKKPRIDQSSMLNKDDKIKGKTLECTTTEPIGMPTVKKFSGRHKAKFAIAKPYVYCNIYIPFY